MKGGSDIVSTIQHLKMADYHLMSFINEHQDSKGARFFQQFRNRINWMFNEIKYHPLLPDVVKQGVEQEINTDEVFAVPAINEKVPLIPPHKRQLVEDFIDKILQEQD